MAFWDAYLNKVATRPTQAGWQYFVNEFRPITQAYSLLANCVVKCKKSKNRPDRVMGYLNSVLKNGEKQNFYKVWETGILLKMSETWVVARVKSEAKVH